MITLTYPEAIFLAVMLTLVSFMLGFATSIFFSTSPHSRADILTKTFAITWSLMWALLTVWSIFTEGQSVSFIYDASGLITVGYVFGKKTAERTLESTVNTVKQVKELTK